MCSRVILINNATNNSCNCKKKQNNYRSPGRPQLELGLMLDVTYQYLASGSMFTDLQWDLKLAPNTISEVVQEVCLSIVDIFWEEFIVTPSTETQ